MFTFQMQQQHFGSLPGQQKKKTVYCGTSHDNSWVIVWDDKAKAVIQRDSSCCAVHCSTRWNEYTKGGCPVHSGGQCATPPPISKSDEAFLEDGIEFVWGTKDLSVDELNMLFEKVGFPRRDPGRLATALANTHTTVWVRAARKSRLAKEGQLLGFGRATSDGSLSATIWDVAVAPQWQRGGIGRGLVERLTAHLVQQGIPTVTLYAEPGVVGLYEKLGFVKDPMAVKGLAFQSKSERGKELVASLTPGRS
eukprot:jgi/Picre1/35023/NNA_002488.t1